MLEVPRRTVLVGLASTAAALAFSDQASATIVRAVSLRSLGQSSRRIAVVTALAATSHYEDLGRRRRIVTDTRMRVEAPLAKGEGMEAELIVRTLGGSVGGTGELVHGQAQLAIGETCVAFLLEGPGGIHYVNAMAQGHYPLERDRRVLAQSPDLPHILDLESSAVKELVGRELSAATTRIRGAVAP